MNFSYFLGANTKSGFFSLYDGFCRSGSDYLTIIKGGPGTGKSGFMRRIGAAAEERGLDAEYVLCSGDPDSLDGVYIPELHRGWVDGTAPHVIEPRHIGSDSNYVNLAEFCSLPFSSQSCFYVNQIYDGYKSEYGAAYSFLASSAALREACIPPLLREEQCEALRRRIRNILKRQKPKDETGSGGTRQCFLHALSCAGELYLNSEVSKLCKLVYQFDGLPGGADLALKIAADEAMALGSDRLICRSPLDPELYDAVLLPGWSLGFVSGGYDISGVRRIRLDAMLDAAALKPYRAEIREGRQLDGQLTAMALARLSRAKALHDELEEYYKAAMDFAALTEFEENYIQTLF